MKLNANTIFYLFSWILFIDFSIKAQIFVIQNTEHRIYKWMHTLSIQYNAYSIKCGLIRKNFIQYLWPNTNVSDYCVFYQTVLCLCLLSWFTFHSCDTNELSAHELLIKCLFNTISSCKHDCHHFSKLLSVKNSKITKFYDQFLYQLKGVNYYKLFSLY